MRCPPAIAALTDVHTRLSRAAGRAGFDFAVRKGQEYFCVVVSGAPVLDEYVALVHLLGLQAGSWPVRRALFDLRGLSSTFCPASQHDIGVHLAASWGEFERIAIVAQAPKDFYAQARSARRNGVDVMPFFDWVAAHAWLVDGGAQVRPAAAEPAERTPPRPGSGC